jgi:hypothetical protein
MLRAMFPSVQAKNKGFFPSNQPIDVLPEYPGTYLKLVPAFIAEPWLLGVPIQFFFYTLAGHDPRTFFLL